MWGGGKQLFLEQVLPLAAALHADRETTRKHLLSPLVLSHRHGAGSCKQLLSGASRERRAASAAPAAAELLRYPAPLGAAGMGRGDEGSPSWTAMMWGWLREDMISISLRIWTRSCSSLILSFRMDFIATCSQAQAQRVTHGRGQERCSFPKPIAEREPHTPASRRSSQARAQWPSSSSLVCCTQGHSSTEATPVKGNLSSQDFVLPKSCCCAQGKGSPWVPARETCRQRSSPGLLPQVAQPCFTHCGLQELCPGLQPPLDHSQPKECDLHT